MHLYDKIKILNEFTVPDLISYIDHRKKMEQYQKNRNDFERETEEAEQNAEYWKGLVNEGRWISKGNEKNV